MMSIYNDDPFFNVPRTTRVLSEGEAEFPILYYDVSTLVALFQVDRGKAAAKLINMGLKPGLHWGGQAIAGLAFYEYRKTSIGPYNEVGLAIAACPAHVNKPISGWLNLYADIQRRSVGFHILNLPVTTRIAWAGGREMWGYPKFVTDIPFKLTDHHFDSAVMDPKNGKSIARLSGQLGPGVPAPPLSLVLYSQLDDCKLRATVNVRGAVRLRGGGKLRLSVGDSDHDMADNLHDLGLDNARPLLVMDTHQFQSRLNLGEAVTW